MSNSVFETWGRTAFRRRRLILLLALGIAVLGGVWGTSIFARAQTAGGFDAPNSQSQREAALATQSFGRDSGDVVVLYSSGTLTTASPLFRQAVTSTLAALPRSAVESSASYWSTGSPRFASASGHQTYAVIELTGASDSARQDSYDAIKSRLSAPALRSQVGGVVPTDETIDQQTTASITRAEGLSFPILLILLLLTFGSLTAASLPLAIGALGILGSFTALRLLTLVKLLGVGMIVALVIDATLVRMLLVPAVMRLLGDANWWAPAPLRRLYARYGIREDPAGERPAGSVSGARR